MRIWVTRRPLENLYGISLSSYQPGQVYDVNVELAEYLVAKDYALIEMRNEDRPVTPEGHERRKAKLT